MAAAQHPADAVERVGRAAAVSGLLMLHTAAEVIDTGQAQAHDMKRVERPLGVRQVRG